MRIPILTFGAFASILTINSAFATSSTVTSKDYVDAAVETKQDVIPSKNVTITIDETEMDVPSIVLYPADGENAGTIGETGFVTSDMAYAKYNETTEEYNLNDYGEWEVYDYRVSDYSSWLEHSSNRDGVGEYAVSAVALSNAIDLLDAAKASHMHCAGWPDGATYYDATHTDGNCWLWNKN